MLRYFVRSARNAAAGATAVGAGVAYGAAHLDNESTSAALLYRSIVMPCVRVSWMPKQRTAQRSSGHATG